jgi:PKD repeat protein
MALMHRKLVGRVWAEPTLFRYRAWLLARVVALFAFAVGLGVASAATYSATWTQVSSSNSPGAPLWRGWTAMTWVGAQNRIVMWGGSGAVFMNDVMGLDPVAASWTTLEPATNCPGNTMFAPPNGSDENGVAYDPINNALWIYNGGSGYRCATPAAVGRTAGAGTTALSIVDPTLPSAVTDFYQDWSVRDGNGAKVRVNAYNGATKTLTLSGAINVSPGAAYDLYVDWGDGTWSYSFNTRQYSKLALRHWGYAGYLPPPRRSPGFAADATRAFVFGGVDYDNGTYKLDFATRSYSVALAQGLASSPPARGQITHQFVYDSQHDRFVLFGGRCFEPARCTYQGMLDDTWIYNANTNVWTQVTPAVRPPPRNQGHMFFDAANGVVVLYGGSGTGGVVHNDLWTFDTATLTWTQQAMPTSNPGGVYLGQVAYAPTTACGYLVYGLRAGANASGTTWRLCLAPTGGGGNAPPLASFTTTPAAALVGAPIAMSAAGSSDPDGSIVSYAWEFGDATTGSGVSVTKSYATPGTKTVRLTVTDNGGLAASTTRTVSITAGNLPPVASFAVTPSSAPTGAPVAFSAAASADPDGSIVSYAWNFGDGTIGSGATVGKSYATAGIFTATLTVADNGGLTASTSRTVTITAGNIPPVANFAATPTPTTIGTPITFSGAASADLDGTIVTYAWNFGDGTSGSGAAVNKSYTTAGTFSVTLTVTDNGGLTGSASAAVIVTSSGGGASTVWVEDALPSGAIPGGDEPIAWITANPPPYSGARAHQSSLANGIHQHYFVNAGSTLPVGVGDALFSYIYLDPVNPPRTVMLQFYDGSWEHRAYWGASLIPWGGQYMGALPPAGQWARLQVPASVINLEGRIVSGIAYTLYDGRATWDASGKQTSGTNQSPTANFTLSRLTTTTRTPIAMAATASADPDGSITSYVWDFGDGTTASGALVSKAYVTPGTYTVTLTVTDNGGLTATTTGLVNITVRVPSPWNPNTFVRKR